MILTNPHIKDLNGLNKFRANYWRGGKKRPPSSKSPTIDDIGIQIGMYAENHKKNGKNQNKSENLDFWAIFVLFSGK